MKHVATFSLILGLLLTVCGQWSFGREPAKPTVRKNLNSLKSEDSLLRDWVCDGKVRVETRGVHLVGDSRLTSNFRLADGAMLMIGYVANNRNLYVDVCGESLEFRAADKHGSEAYGVAVARRGRTLIYGKFVNGKFSEQNKILISKDLVATNSKVSITSRPVWIPGARSDQFEDIQIRLLTVTGNVVMP